MKIHVTGNAGAGKTTLAKTLADALEMPVSGLDKVVWQAGWVKTPPDVKAARIQQLISKDEWIIEGVSDRVRRAADIIIFLDVPRLTACWRCAKRNWKHLFTGRAELPENCPEILIIPRLIKIIWRFKSHVRPKILADMESQTHQSFHIRNKHDLKGLYQYLNMRV